MMNKIYKNNFKKNIFNNNNIIKAKRKIKNYMFKHLMHHY